MHITLNSSHVFLSHSQFQANVRLVNNDYFFQMFFFIDLLAANRHVP